MISAIVAMDNAGYIIGSYALTFAAIGAFAARMLRKNRQLADQVGDDHKYWT
jgi:hypothetical protein